MQKTETKLLLYLLQCKENVNNGYRQIAKETGISLGSAQCYMSALEQKGYIVTTEHGRILRKREQLIEKWVRGYADGSKDKFYIGRFRFIASAVKMNWTSINLPEGTHWGGEAAAFLIDGFIQPERWDIYVKESADSLISTGRMVPDKNGEIFVFQQFWMGEDIPLQVVYADLVASCDDRCAEVAARIRKNI